MGDTLSPTQSDDGRGPVQTTAAGVGKDHPFADSLAVHGHEDRLKFEAFKKQVKSRTIKSTSVCGHFWVILIGFFIGLLCARGEHLVIRIIKRLQSPTQWA